MREAVLCGCSKGKKCPKIAETPDGFVLSDEDQPGKPVLTLTHEEAGLLIDFLRAAQRE
jgi:hypothetical protein